MANGLLRSYGFARSRPCSLQPFNPIMAAAAAAAAAVAHLQLNANGGGAGGGPEAGPGGGGGEGGGWEPHAAAGLAGAGGGVGGEGGMGAGGAGLAGLLHHPDVAFAHQLELTEQVRPGKGAHKLELVRSSRVCRSCPPRHSHVLRVERPALLVQNVGPPTFMGVGKHLLQPRCQGSGMMGSTHCSMQPTWQPLLLALYRC